MIKPVYFESVSELIAMAGHGGYVWSVVLLNVIAITLTIVLPQRAYRRALQNAKDEQS